MLYSLGLLFVLGGASYLLARPIRIVPGPMIALLLGALVGPGSPAGGNLLWSSEQVLPPEPLFSFRAIGAIFLMWGAGVELEVAVLRHPRSLLRAMGIGVGGAALSALATWGLLSLGVLGDSFSTGERYGLTLLSAASAIPVLLAIVQSLGAVKHPLTASALAAALIVDLILVAAIPLVIASEHGPEPPLEHFLRTLVYLVLMIVLAEGPWQSGIRALGKRFRAASSRKAVVITCGFGLTIGVVALAQQLGVELLPAAIGWGIGSKHFFFPEGDDGHNPFFDTFFPFEASYFALAGAMFDLRLLSWEGLLFGLVAVLAKIVGGGVAGRGGLRVGTLLVPRGAVDLVLAVSLLANGVLTPRSYALAVTMIAVTTIGGAALARLAFRGALAEPGRELERLRVTH
jgi:Kef-type K+ transport system membrane component KefB